MGRPPNGVRKSLLKGVLGKAKRKTRRRDRRGKPKEPPATKSRFLFEAEKIYKEKDLPKISFQFAEDGSSSSSTKRTKMVKVMVDKRLKYLLEKNPTKPFSVPENPVWEASIQRMIELEKDILKQFETKGYAVYDREVEVTDDGEVVLLQQKPASGSSSMS